MRYITITLNRYFWASSPIPVTDSGMHLLIPGFGGATFADMVAVIQFGSASFHYSQGIEVFTHQQT